MHRTTRRAPRLAIAAVLGSSVIASSVLVAPPATTSAATKSKSRAFEHVSTFDVRDNGTEVAEIVDATADGRTLVYTDSATGQIGFVDITDPADPGADGALELGGEPTSVAVAGNYAAVAVDTSDGDFLNPTGDLVVVDLSTRAVVRTFALGGQPDSVAISPDQKFLAVVLENQRDEDLNDGLIPQLPGGELVVIRVSGTGPAAWQQGAVDLTGLAMPAASDPEPEYVDINSRNQAVVSLQENNHLAVVDLRTRKIISDFSAGTVDLAGIDATEDEFGPQGNGVISLTDSIQDRRREPDTVGWLTDETFAVANEGDYEDEAGEQGGSRGFTVFDTKGRVVFESGPGFEYEQLRAGHYNEGRSENKGGEPEALEVGRFGDQKFLFVGAERSNSLGVYDAGRRTPEFRQLLPTGVGPEGVKAITQRNLLAVAAETAILDDDDNVLIPSMITLYQLRADASPSMTLTSRNEGADTLPWVAMSGLVGHPTDEDTLYGVSDSFLAEAAIFTIDVASTPAVITDRFVVRDPGGEPRYDLDVEGVAVAPEGGFWLASEGRTNSGSSRPNALVKVSPTGVVEAEVALPPALLAAGLTSSGFEGVAVTGADATEFVYAVIQRGWASDAAGLVKIGRFEVATGEWTFVSYPLDATPAGISPWVGLSEIALLPDGTFAIVERDNQLGAQASIKRVYGVDLAVADFQPFVQGDDLPIVPKSLLTDVLGALEANSVYTPDKLEGLAVAADGQVYLVTDNDGLDDALGQTVFLGLGALAQALGN